MDELRKTRIAFSISLVAFIISVISFTISWSDNITALADEPTLAPFDVTDEYVTKDASQWATHYAEQTRVAEEQDPTSTKKPPQKKTPTPTQYFTPNPDPYPALGPGFNLIEWIMDLFKIEWR